MTDTALNPTKAAVSAATRERLLSAARSLFSRRGINATGVDLILSESGVAKGSLYHHFSGKQGLLLAYLQREREIWHAGAIIADDSAASAAVRLDRMFQGVADSVLAGTFHGCPFTNAIIERPHDREVRIAVDDYCDKLRQHIADITGNAPSSPVVDEIFLLYNGALTSVKLTRDVAYLRRASMVATALVAE